MLIIPGFVLLHAEEAGFVTKPGLGSICLCMLKPIYWAVIKENTVFIAGQQERRMGSTSQKTQTPQWLSGKGF